MNFFIHEANFNFSSSLLENQTLFWEIKNKSFEAKEKEWIIWFHPDPGQLGIFEKVLNFILCIASLESNMKWTNTLYYPDPKKWKWRLIYWLISANPGFWDFSDSELSDKSVRNPIGLFSSFSQLKQIIPGLGLEPPTSKRNHKGLKVIP